MIGTTKLSHFNTHSHATLPLTFTLRLVTVVSTFSSNDLKVGEFLGEKKKLKGGKRVSCQHHGIMPLFDQFLPGNTARTE